MGPGGGGGARRATFWLFSSSSYAPAPGAVSVIVFFLVAICIPLGFFCVALFSHNEMPNLRTQPFAPSAVPAEQVTSKNFTIAPAANNSTAAQPFKEHEMNEAEKDETFQPFESFNHTNLHQNSWCPRATCNNSPMCQPCKKRFLFIIATGRSGSTSLLSMLNYLPGVSEQIKRSFLDCDRQQSL